MAEQLIDMLVPSALAWLASSILLSVFPTLRIGLTSVRLTGQLVLLPAYRICLNIICCFLNAVLGCSHSIISQECRRRRACRVCEIHVCFGSALGGSSFRIVRGDCFQGSRVTSILIHFQLLLLCTQPHGYRQRLKSLFQGLCVFVVVLSKKVDNDF